MGQGYDPIRTVSWCEAHGGLAEDVQRVPARIDTERPSWGTYACGTCRQRRAADPGGCHPKAEAPRAAFALAPGKRSGLSTPSGMVRDMPLRACTKCSAAHVTRCPSRIRNSAAPTCGPRSTPT